MAFDLATGELIMSSMNPTNQTSSGGLQWLSTTTGTQTDGVRYYGNATDYDFGKAAGLGDVEIICLPAPVEIGNLVWEDDNKNGKQDACENGIPGVNVQLYTVDGTLLAETTTNDSGEYYFQSAASSDGATWLNADGVDESEDDAVQILTDYLIVFGEGQWSSSDSKLTLAGTAFDVTALNAPGDDSMDNIDSDVDVTNLSVANGDLPPDQLQAPVRINSPGCADHTIDLGLVSGSDYGDLPDSYGTTEVMGGPSHGISEDLYLGACVDEEDDGQPEAMAGMMTGGDDNTSGDETGTCVDGDEDGVMFVTPLIPDGQACVQVTANNTTGADAFLQGWIDYNGSGMFEAGEELTGFDFGTGDAVIPNGGVIDVLYCFEVPATATFTNLGEAFARFRLSSTGGLASGGPAGNGEVEDYKEKLAKIGSYVWNDMNANGLQDEASTDGLEGAQLTLVFTNPFGDDITYVTSTGPDGVYSFCGLIAGNYTLSLPTPPPMFSAATMVGVGTDPEVDSDNHAGVGIVIGDVMGLPENENSPTGDNPGGEGFPDMQDDLQYDFGYFMPANIGDFVWEDLNDDGIQDPNEPGLEGVTVSVYACTGGVKGMLLTSTMTDGMGFYQFTGLAPNMEYCVEFDVTTSNHPQAGLLEWSPQNTGNGANDSDVDPADPTNTGCTDSYSPEPNETFPDFDAGVNVRDYGDLPQGPYTTTGPEGPSHSVPTNPLVFLGQGVDAESDGQPNTDATNDGDDEDGVEKPNMIIRGSTATFIINAVNNSGVDAKVVAFVDWNGNGVFTDADEMMSQTVSSSGPVLLTFNVPADAPINLDLGMRVRISTDPAFVNADPMLDGGFAYDGEVEDCMIQVMAFDYGDLADVGAGTGEQDYETASANGGPSHKIVTGDMGNVTLKIGADIDDELDGQQSADADGDGDDEDGFDPNVQMFETTVAQDITVPVMNMTGSDAKLTMYVDWDNDGVFEDMYSVTVPNNATDATLPSVTPPLTTALNQDIGVRFRLTTDTAMDPNGLASDGEVEDYEIMVMGYDYGDLADAGAGTGVQDYETASANGGPRHKIVTDDMGNVTLKIGADVDDEGDGQQSADADGDGDDEDGFDPNAQMFETTVSQDIDVPVMNMTGVDAKLSMYVDWDNDGVFEDMYSVTVPNNATNATLSNVTPPLTTALNQDIGVRFRLTTDMAMDPNGDAPDGEVEDYEIMVMGYDYGDLVDAGAGASEQDYETASANGGPRHKIVTDDMGNVILKIGAEVDDEADGQQSADADGDNLAGDNDEDGFDPAALTFETTVAQDITVPVMNMTGGDAKLTMYVDWDNDGVFEDMYSETVLNNATEATLASVTPPLTTALNQDIGVRFRLTTSTVMDPNGDAPDGEVEDYEIMVMGYDYGDLADAGIGTGEQDYETESANGGPRHKIITDDAGNVTLKIGVEVDDEADGQQSADADGDNAADIDDEDGFDPSAFMFETTVAQDITVPVMNMTGGDAKLTMYVDWDNDGVFEDMYSETVANNATDVTLTNVTPPLTTELNQDIGVRFRLTTDMTMDPNGEAPDGEIEDYEIMVMGYDYGDLADSGAGTGEQDYETESANGGPRHKIISDDMGNVTLKIGAEVDDEADGQQSADADGDNAADAADEDGFDPAAQMFETTVAQDITVPVMNMTGGDAKLTMYVDWDNDGVFEDMYSATVPDNATDATLADVTPPLTTALNQDIGVRFRLTTDMTMDPNGDAP
ncbi:MAG: GEVED domain-containing protein, partial [Bacteroidota bacterium]